MTSLDLRDPISFADLLDAYAKSISEREALRATCDAALERDREMTVERDEAVSRAERAVVDLVQAQLELARIAAEREALRAQLARAREAWEHNGPCQWPGGCGGRYVCYQDAGLLNAALGVEVKR